MFGSGHFFDIVTGAFLLSALFGGVVLALVAGGGALAFRHAGETGIRGVAWRGALVLVGAILAWLVLDRSALREHAAERRALDARAAELAARVYLPGSALGCLDAVANTAVDTACERALFARPETVAAAVSYVDARLALLASATDFAARDRSYEPAVERMRRAIEADRFGIVAHVLTTRGCNAADCADLKLLRDTRRVLSNLRERAFDANVTTHATAWGNADTPVAAARPPGGSSQAVSTDGTASQLPLVSKYDFPSSASIPPINIMSAEPMTPPAPEQKVAPDAKPAPARAPRRQQTAREPLPPPPLTIAPQAAPNAAPVAPAPGPGAPPVPPAPIPSPSFQ